ncbi:hypothetical protein [Desulfomonile tiedjei]|uniref:Uncharacterized protein n=1 Tax=Desulfomonile tiedjei (strain ATCC 49306 / DSM 6799 / DCB-1) TaxID=706587 RepID=I4C1F3_DESTA|nr:hypothetical protein [Desulfomonile tiedjei]AFM23394.1 hypothetical protein Desti_0668 [Desulfomonile tiedjei DSM 6799]
MIHAKVYGAILAVLMLLFCGMLADRLFRGHSAIGLGDLKAISRVLPSADPGMDNSARYIRHWAHSTPGAAFPDYPGQPDYLPSGMMWPPPPFFVGSAPQGPLFQVVESADEGAGK